MRLASLVAFLGALLAGACTREPDHETRAASTVETPDGKLAVQWRPVPDPIPLNAMFGLDLVVTPSDATTVVEVDAGMPGHGHGMTVRPKTVRRTDGTFEARGLLFHMPGEWEITVKAGEETLRFPVTVP